MSAGEGKPWGQMMTVALDIAARLRPYCERIAIAGSLRRGKPLVKDIELVCQPYYRPVWNGLVNQLDGVCEWLLKEGVFQKRLKTNGAVLAWGKEWTKAQLAGDESPPPGSRYKAAWYIPTPNPSPLRGEGNKVAVDLFIVLRDRQWGPTLLLRTGPGEANQALVTQEGIVNQNGIRGVLPRGMTFDDGAVWRDGQRLDTPDEQAVFEVCELPYLPPYQRTVDNYHHFAKTRAWKREHWGGRPGRVPWLWEELSWVTNVPERRSEPTVAAASKPELAQPEAIPQAVRLL